MTLTPTHSVTVVRTMTRKPLPFICVQDVNPYNRRFVSRDSFASSNNDPLSLNLYIYCHNNPVSGTDCTGHLMYAIYLQAIISIKIQPLKKAVLSGKQLGRTALSIFFKQHTIR